MHPALGDLATGNAKDAHGPPREGLASMLHLAAGEDDRALIVGEHPANIDTERSVAQLASSGEVAQHGLAPVVVACDRALAGHMPGHVVAEHRADGSLLCTCVEAILAFVELADESRVRMPLGHPDSISPAHATGDDVAHAAPTRRR